MKPALCVCGCPRDAHRHYTAATYCSRCECPRYRRARWWRKRQVTR